MSISGVTQAISHRWSALKHKKPFIVRWVAESWKQNKTKNKTEPNRNRGSGLRKPKPNRNRGFSNNRTVMQNIETAHHYLQQFSDWCATRHYNLDSFLIHTNMLSSSQGKKPSLDSNNLNSITGQYGTSVLVQSSSKESLHIDLLIMQNAINCFRSSNLPTDSSKVLSLLS